MSDAEMSDTDSGENASVPEEPAAKEAGTEQPPRPARSKRKRKSGRSEGRSSQYWMIVSSPDNFRKTRELGYTIQGLKSRHRRRVETMRVGDRLLYYITGRMAFAATVTVASPMYEDHTPIWRSARRLDYVRKWPPEHWTLAFQGHIHALPRNDFAIVEDEIARSSRRRKPLAG